VLAFKAPEAKAPESTAPEAKAAAPKVAEPKAPKAKVVEAPDEAVSAPVVVVEPAVVEAPVALVPDAVTPAAVIPAAEVAAEAPVSMSRPVGLPAAREGGADDLKMISGVGPKIEMVLNDLGIFHFSQIAGWSAAEVAWVDDYLKFRGRITRDNWIAQADALATGGREEYVKRFGKEPR
jgi:NADH-quinone oxidoreductase subunit E